ncbi:MAG: proprotein convertase P-domain-containing protein [Phycisphaerales bacterium]
MPKSIIAGLALAILTLQSFAFGVIYCSFGSTVGKPLGSGEQIDVVVETQLFVPLKGTIKDFDLSLDIKHTSFCDLSIVIQSPSGKTITVSQYDHYNFILNKQALGWLTLDNESTVTIDQAPNICIGSFKPSGSKPLSTFYSTQSYGLWKIRICDHIYSDTGIWDGIRFDLGIEPQMQQAVLNIPEPSTLIISIVSLIIFAKKR